MKKLNKVQDNSDKYFKELRNKQTEQKQHFPKEIETKKKKFWS